MEETFLLQWTLMMMMMMMLFLYRKHLPTLLGQSTELLLAFLHSRTNIKHVSTITSFEIYCYCEEKISTVYTIMHT